MSLPCRCCAWWANLALERKGLVVILLPFLAVLAGFVVQHSITRSAEHGMLWIDQSQEVRCQMRTTLADILATETELQRFIITHSDQFLEPYRLAHSLTLASVSKLKKLASRDADHLTRIEGLTAAIDQKLALMGQLEEAVPLNKQALSPTDVEELLNHSRALTGAIRTQLMEMDNQEADHQLGRVAAFEQHEQLQNLISGGTVMLAMLAGIFAVLLFSHSIAKRAHAIQENAVRLAQELPLLPVKGGKDELGTLAKALRKSGVLLAGRTRALRAEKARLSDALARATEAEAQLRQSKEQLRGILDNTTALIYLKDAEARYLLINPAYSEILGLPPEAVIGKTAFDLFGPEAEQCVDNDFAVLKAGVPMEFEETISRGGINQAYLSTKFPLHDSNGRVCAVGGIATNITTRKTAEYALELAKKAADQASKAKSDFLSRMSHELRTPLNGILGFAQLLEMDVTTDEDKESVQQIMCAGRHLLGLINEVLDLSRIEAGHLNITAETVSTGEIIDEALQLVRPMAEQRNLVVTCDGDSSLLVEADRQRLMQVLLNLCSNAVKYNREFGTVLVKTTSTDSRVRIEVSDTGRGIPSHQLTRLFTPFERLQADETEIQGTGLGLALSKRLVEAMHGTMAVTSMVDRGTSFSVDLPRAIGTSLQPEVITQPPSLDSGKTIRDERKLLYIEDNLANFRLVERIVKARTSLSLIPAMQGRLGLELAQEHTPDLILLDVNLPDMPGMEVLRALRANEVTANIPVAIISADAMPKQIDSLLAAGAQAYLVKPINVTDFLATLIRLLPQNELVAA